jgi:hypothetical protein
MLPSGLVKLETVDSSLEIVIPAKGGIQNAFLDAGFHRHDG